MRVSAARSLVLAGATALALAAPVLPTSGAAFAGAELDGCSTGAGASAKGGRAADHRDISASEQRSIETRSKKLAAAKAPTATTGNSKSAIPVYIHVMLSSTGAGDVTPTQITNQITVLNQTYGGRDVNGAGTATGVGFTLAGVDRYRNNQWHVDKQSSTYRSQTRQGGKNALNIWLVDFKYLGIATFPWDYAKQPGLDGIRVQYSSLPGGTATNYNLGETATHEAGHWLGLYHTFQGGCTPPGDEVSDTPAEATATSGCPTGKDTCTAAGTDPIHNYMDYSYDSCYFTFTPGQSSRIDQMWTAYRA
jgi:hypothetical protein